jgi:hypothetical protein
MVNCEWAPLSFPATSPWQIRRFKNNLPWDVALIQYKIFQTERILIFRRNVPRQKKLNAASIPGRHRWELKVRRNDPDGG